MITKHLEVTVDIDTARSKLRASGLNTAKLSDEEIFDWAVRRNYAYGFTCYNIVKPDMREKVEEYIKELDLEIARCCKLAEQNMQHESSVLTEIMVARAQVLGEVKNDLQSRLEELV